MCVAAIGGKPYYIVSVKRHLGEPGHTRDARSHTGAHKGTQITSGRRSSRVRAKTRRQPHNHPNPPTHNLHVSVTTSKPRPTQQPQARSRPHLPAADSEEAAPRANPTLPPPAPRAPPRACSKAVGEMKSRAADT